MKFSKATVAALALPAGKTDHVVFDDTLPGFGIRLRAGGKRGYVVQYRAGGRQRRESLGDARTVDLDEARRAARRKLGAVATGHDPAAERAEARARAKRTLGAIVPIFLAHKRVAIRPSTGEPPRPATMVAATMQLEHRWALLHSKPIHEITRLDISARLAEIRLENGPGAARAAYAGLSDLLGWAVAEGIVAMNPIIGARRPAAARARERVLDDHELGAAWRACADLGEYGAIVRLLVLTGCRRQEIGDLAWDELDLEHGTMRIPGTRTKNHRDHALPLPPLAIEVIEAIPACRLDHGRRLFGEGAGGFSGWSSGKAKLDAALAGAELPSWVIHDIRRSVATGLANLGVQPHVIEVILNHVSGHKAGVAGTYNRSPYEREARAAMMLWGEHIEAIAEGRGRKIVPLTARR
ncbi:MAG TPA: site-specific integrase [Xanthobacteraceae bacterium]